MPDGEGDGGVARSGSLIGSSLISTRPDRTIDRPRPIVAGYNLGGFPCQGAEVSQRTVLIAIDPDIHTVDGFHHRLCILQEAPDVSFRERLRFRPAYHFGLLFVEDPTGFQKSCSDFVRKSHQHAKAAG
jgi:hypothetical protein